MIFMSQSGLSDPTRESDWEEWYAEHLDIMASVPGISSAQRFKSVTPGFPPSLAIYSVASENVFKDPYYLSVRGMGDWLGLIDWRYYKRNLFEGSEHAPEVADGQVMLIADRDAPESALAGVDWAWLECVGIDRSTPYRGIAVVPEAHAQKIVARHVVGVYRPATLRHVSR
jgi:hypothetical protein